MNSLQKKLEEAACKKLSSNKNAVEEVKLLLEGNAAEEKQLLKNIGLGNSLFEAERQNEDVIIRNTKNDEYGRVIVHEDEIKAMCKKYRLYFKLANQYMGAIPNDLGVELNNFVKDKNIPVSASQDYSNFFIIAPPKMFAGYENPAQVFYNAISTANNKRAERIRRRREDPILVFRLPERNGYYAVIKSWGNEFTWLRRIYGVLTRKKTVHFLNFFICTAIVYGLIKAAFAQANYLIDLVPIDKYNNGDGYDLLGILLFIVLAIITPMLFIFNVYPKGIRKEIVKKITQINK